MALDLPVWETVPNHKISQGSSNDVCFTINKHASTSPNSSVYKLVWCLSLLLRKAIQQTCSHKSRQELESLQPLPFLSRTWTAVPELFSRCLSHRSLASIPQQRLYNLPLHICLTMHNYHYCFKAFHPTSNFHLLVCNFSLLPLGLLTVYTEKYMHVFPLDSSLGRNINFRTLRLQYYLIF